MPMDPDPDDGIGRYPVEDRAELTVQRRT